MDEPSEKRVAEDEINSAERQDDGISLKDDTVLTKAQLLGATPDEVIEAEEHGRTLDLEEAKKVRSTKTLRCLYFDIPPARRNPCLLP